MAWLLTSGGYAGAPLLKSTYSCFQMFKLTLEYLVKFDFEQDQLFLTKDGEPLAHQEVSGTFSQNSLVKSTFPVMLTFALLIHLAASILLLTLASGKSNTFKVKLDSRWNI